MKFLRIGDKIVDRDRLVNIVSEILQRRAVGATQQEVAAAMGLERSFVSHLEGLGEVRRGKRIAVIGFPISNREELEEIAQSYAVDFIYFLSEKERKERVFRKTEAEVFDELLELLAGLRNFDVVVFLASSKRIDILARILDKEIVGISIGESPIKRDRKVKPEILKSVLSSVVSGGGLNADSYSSCKFRIFKKR